MKKALLFIALIFSVSAFANQNKQSVYYCQNDKGATHWTNGQCQRPFKPIAHYKVPLNLRFNDQVYIAKMKHEKAQARLKKGSSTLIIGHTKPKPPSQYCQNIEKQLRHYKKLMNIPRSAASMNSLERQRKQLMRQKMNNCM